MEARDLQYFAAVAEHGNLRRAAEAIGISQPALSKTLRRLEKAAGAKIVARTPKGVDLTVMGKALYAHAQRLQLAMDDVLKEVADLNGGRSGLIRIGTNFEAAELLLPQACKILMQHAPDTTVMVTTASNDALLPALNAGTLDLIVSGLPASPARDLEQTPLWEDDYVVCVSETHPLARRKVLKLADLANERWVLPAASTPAWRHIHRAFENAGVAGPKTAMEGNFWMIGLCVAGSTRLVCFTSKWEMDKYARQYRLVKLPVKELAWQRVMGVRYRKDAYLSPAARKFIEILKTEAKKLRKPG